MILNRTSKVKQSIVIGNYSSLFIVIFPHIYLYKRIKSDDMETGSNFYDKQNTSRFKTPTYQRKYLMVTDRTCNTNDKEFHHFKC